MATKLEERKIQRYGWIPDLPDHRDLPYLAPHALLKALPPKMDLRPAFAKIPAYDQKQLGSCTANAIAGALQYDTIRKRRRNRRRCRRACSSTTTSARSRARS